MIVINERWVILVDPHNYIAAKNEPQEKINKDGKPYTYYPTKGYFRNVENAMEFIADEDIRAELTEDTHSLAEAVQVIKDVRREYEQMLRDVIEGAKNENDPGDNLRA